MAIPVDGLSRDQLAKGTDKFPITILYQNKDKSPVVHQVDVTWDEIFSVIGARMFGYIVRRAPAYGGGTGPFPFEESLIEHLRTKVYDDCGNRQIKILAHQVDAILIQPKQLGLVEMEEKDKDEQGRVFRGFTLTDFGEQYLTQLSVQAA
jgi:hypothetical protein